MSKLLESDIKQKAMIIKLGKTGKSPSGIRENTSYAWRVGDRAKDAEVILASVDGIVRGVYTPEAWLDATQANWPCRIPKPGRKGIILGDSPYVADYLGKEIPDKYTRGKGNPILYTW